jgi:hypothetical protein
LKCQKGKYSINAQLQYATTLFTNQGCEAFFLGSMYRPFDFYAGDTTVFLALSELCIFLDFSENLAVCPEDGGFRVTLAGDSEIFGGFVPLKKEDLGPDFCSGIWRGRKAILG